MTFCFICEGFFLTRSVVEFKDVEFKMILLRSFNFKPFKFRLTEFWGDFFRVIFILDLGVFIFSGWGGFRI